MAAVLVLEDDRGFSAAMRYYMEIAGFRVLESTSPAEALCIMRANHIDCIVSDYYVEGGTVRALIQELRRKRLNVPLIVVSGVSPQSDFNAYVHTWLPKPVDLTLLERTVRRASKEALSLTIESAC